MFFPVQQQFLLYGLLTSKANSLTNVFVQVIVSSIRTNRARWCALYKKILDLLDEERKVFLEKALVELVYKFDEKSYRKCLKM